MNFFIRSFGAFVLGIIAILVSYYYFNIPLFPSISIYIVARTFLSDFEDITKAGLWVRKSFVVIATLFALFCWGGNIFLSIKHYPQYMNIIGIILEIATFIAFIGAGYVNVYQFKSGR